MFLSLLNSDSSFCIRTNGCGPFCLPSTLSLIVNPSELSNQLKIISPKFFFSCVGKSTCIMNNTVVCISLYFLMLIIIVFFNLGFQSGNLLHLNGDANTTTSLLHLKPEETYFKHRKLMLQGKCSEWDISISQSRYPTAGIPEFIVQIVNTCVSGCAPSNIHVRCGWFASTRIVNPRTFKRLSFDDCLVNGGLPLKNTQSIRFTYANSFMYPLHFKSASFC